MPTNLNQKDKRTNFTELPSGEILKELLSAETIRNVPKSKKDVHFVDFTTIYTWLDSLNIDPQLFHTEKDPNKILAWGESIQNEVTKKTLSAVKREESKLLTVLTNCANYLGEEDKPKTSDLILVFGSSDLARIDAGISLWKKKIAPIILISGGQPHYSEEKTPEAVIFSRYALTHGIPKDALLVEPNSITMADTVKTCLNLLDNIKFHFNNRAITIVTAWFAQRRAWTYLMKFTPMGFKVYRVNSIIETGRFSQKEWYKNDISIKVVFNEYIKLKVSELVNSS